MKGVLLQKFFSIIVDETSDISNVEQVSVVIRFMLVERGEVLVEEHFLDFGVLIQPLEKHFLNYLKRCYIVWGCLFLIYEHSVTMAHLICVDDTQVYVLEFKKLSLEHCMCTVMHTFLTLCWVMLVRA